MTKTEARYSDAKATKLVSLVDESRQVFWFDGTRFVENQVSASVHAKGSKAPAIELFPEPSGAVARFRARLSAQDHVNGQTGVPLKFAAHVIRQDRAAFHVTKHPDPDDTSDPLYDNADARAALTVLLEKAISPTENDRIMKGTPLVDVTVWPDRAEILTLSE